LRLKYGKCNNKLQDFIDVLKVELKDNISSGIKEEINSLLEQYE
jgi:hypothetical protein